MPIILHSFASKNGDPFNNLTVEVTDDKVLIHVHSYTESTEIAMSRDEAARLALKLNRELAKTV